MRLAGWVGSPLQHVSEVAVEIARSTVRRLVVEDEPNQVLQARIIDLAQARRRSGYRRIHDLLRREGVRANHKSM